jgi:signal peptidase II
MKKKAAAPVFFRSKYGLLAWVGTLTLVLDQWTKWLVHSRFRVGETYDLIDPVLALTYVRNKGAAFGILQTANPAFREPFFFIVPVVAISVISYLFYRLEERQKVSALALSLVLSGAVGNLVDRARLGFVVDFVDIHWKEVYHWPMFNVADSCIVVGVSLLFLLSFREPGKAKTKVAR